MQPQQACDLIQSLRREHPSTAVLAATAGLEAAQLAAMFDAGICDFVALPVVPQELLARVYRLQGASLPIQAPRSQAPSERLRCFVGNSPNFACQIAKLPVFAGCNAGVLITGETGTGKEVCAQAVHYLSKRADRPWVAVNCGAIPTELVEDELFGHVRGAYTTACATRQGLVREAEGGTLFLDDIDCLPLMAQSKLLRFLQEREYRPVGSNAVQRADVRVIAASNLQLAQLVASKQFRQDLYFRLNVLSLELPPLRERTQDDIRELALHFIERSSAQFERQVTGLSLAALQRLRCHPWPGNVRELQHVMERAVLLCKGPMIMASDIELGDRPAAAAPPKDSFQSAKASVVRQFERSFVEQLLAEHAGNVTHAALAAKKNRRAFFELMRKHSIEPQRFRVPVA
ncbi:sigma-54-dependent transcriptional regulator [Variovorax saccharolyticus]|uniref:sigma-54-dependent transcriptional regulator n=1 Tax=Variovorax saccharolyticus TaxID=3053516 RepID=UPI002576112A|nr:sigma-54 dependent transcriptional regulator [Variovorax sp. J31P216]